MLSGRPFGPLYVWSQKMSSEQYTQEAFLTYYFRTSRFP